MASLIQKLEAAATERSLGKSTVACYSFWTRKLYDYCKLPGSQWTGELVREWMLHLADQNYSAVSRKQALNGVVFVFKYVLKRDLGQLDLPPMPKVRHTLRIIPSRDELGRIFSGLHGQVKLMCGLMYGSGLRVLCECCRIRVQDVDLEALTLRIHDGEGTLEVALRVGLWLRMMERAVAMSRMGSGWTAAGLPAKRRTFSTRARADLASL